MTELTMFVWFFFFVGGEDCRRTLEYCARNATEFSILGELICRSLVVKNVEGNSVDGGLTWEASEGH